MTVIATEPRTLTCQGCGRSPAKTDATVGEARLVGWRVHDGVSVTGVPLAVRLCPPCTIHGAGEAAGYDAHCRTCRARLSTELAADYDGDGWWEGDPPLESATRAQAEKWACDHDCRTFLPPLGRLEPAGTPDTAARPDTVVEAPPVGPFPTWTA